MEQKKKSLLKKLQNHQSLQLFIIKNQKIYNNCFKIVDEIKYRITIFRNEQKNMDR